MNYLERASFIHTKHQQHMKATLQRLIVGGSNSPNYDVAVMTASHKHGFLSDMIAQELLLFRYVTYLEGLDYPVTDRDECLASFETAVEAISHESPHLAPALIKGMATCKHMLFTVDLQV